MATLQDEEVLGYVHVNSTEGVAYLGSRGLWTPDGNGKIDADFDDDNDIDGDEFGVYQRCMSGPNRPGNPNGAN